jgi:hypothetical protein
MTDNDDEIDSRLMIVLEISILSFELNFIQHN